MTERISSDPSRNACRRPEDEPSEALPKESPAPTCRDRLVSAPPVDWDKVPTSCDANAADAARNAGQGEGGTCGGWPGAPMTGRGSTPAPRSEAPPAKAAPAKKDARATPPRTAGASGNGARTAERDFLKGAYAAEGYTHDRGSVFAGAAALKGHMEDGVDAEELSVSVQVGEQNEAQATLARLGHSNEHGSSSVDALTANAHIGLDNSDGSHGVNAGASASWVTAEATMKRSGWSVTGGVAAGIGAEAHVGVRDDDKDGKPEICVRGALSVAIVGACIELPVVIRP
ncbi:MAG: hypothetical protein KF894_18845 [Labilithrix sp.]|nr:hypothetical protein [Labilithrix sp.]